MLLIFYFPLEEMELKADAYLPEHNNMTEILDLIVPGMLEVWTDHFPLWQASGESYLGGKPYWLDLQSDEISLFFDDNISDKQFICVNILGLETSLLSLQVQIEMQKVLQEKLISFGWLVPVKTWEAATQKDFFTSRITKILELQKNPNYLSQCHVEIETILAPYREKIAKEKMKVVSNCMRMGFIERFDCSKFFRAIPSFSSKEKVMICSTDFGNHQ